MLNAGAVVSRHYKLTLFLLEVIEETGLLEIYSVQKSIQAFYVVEHEFLILNLDLLFNLSQLFAI